MYFIEFVESAKVDLVESIDWYNRQRLDLGEEFFKEVEITVMAIREHPFRYPIRFAGIFRFAILKRFPFLIVYSIEQDIIYINAIFHTSRKSKDF